MSKGIAYFKDGHTEEIISYYKTTDDESITFNTHGGQYVYRNVVNRTESGYLFTRSVFKKMNIVFSSSGIEFKSEDVPIERIVLL